MVLWPQRNRALAHPSIHSNVLTRYVHSRIREEEEDEAAHFFGGATPVGGDGGEDGGEEGRGHFTKIWKGGREKRRKEGREGGSVESRAEQYVNALEEKEYRKRRLSKKEGKRRRIKLNKLTHSSQSRFLCR